MDNDWTVGELKAAKCKLAAILGVHIRHIELAWQNQDNYCEVRVGSDERHRSRIVLNACPELKKIQQLLNRKVFRHINLSAAVHGFVPGRSFKTFLMPHRNSVEFLSLDFKDAFNQVKAEQVVKFLFEYLKNKGVAKLITLLVTYKGEVPQGVASSPYLFNIACRQLDEAILQQAKTHNLVYTRYGDDICLSSVKEVNLRDFTEQIICLCKKFGFQLNFQKIRCQNARHRSPEISGVIIEKGGFRISKRKYLDQLRALIDRAVWDESISVEQVEGRLGMVRVIYRASGRSRHYLPGRLRKPYEKFRWARGLEAKNLKKLSEKMRVEW